MCVETAQRTGPEKAKTSQDIDAGLKIADDARNG